MSKITKKLYDDYKATKQIVKNAKESHSKNTDQIKAILKPYVDEKYVKQHTNHEITGFKFFNDNEYKIKELPAECEWIKISEKEYYNLYNDNKRYSFKTELKVEEIFEPEYDEIFYKKGIKKRKYLRVYVYETWAYGGYDSVHYDFLLTDIMDEQYLRKEKLKKLEEIV